MPITKSSTMQPGDRFTVKAGEFAGHTAIIVDPKPFPDTDLDRRRKITVEVDGDVVYMLPRLLQVQQVSPAVDAAIEASNVSPLHAVVTDTSVPLPFQVPNPHGEGLVLVPGDITDVDDPRLDPWRPDPIVVKHYINRTMPNGVKDTDFLLSFWDKRESILLVGDTQSGKTMMVQVLAVLAGLQRQAEGKGTGKPLPIFTLSGSSGVTDFDLFGQPTAYITPDGRERLVNLPGVVDLAVRAGGIAYWDELNMMGERTVSSLHPVADYRHAFVNRSKAVRYTHEGTEVFMPEVVQANPDLWIVSTINPAYKGSSMGEAITNRFTWIPWGYDDGVEKKLIPSAAVRLLAQALREARAIKAINTPIGTAALSRMCVHAVEHGPEMAVWLVKAMFLPQEQAKVDSIITDRSILMLLKDEAQAREANSFDPTALGSPLLGGGMADPR